MARKSAHGKSGAESLSIRISGRLKYALELIARDDRRTLSSLAEKTFEDLLRTRNIATIHGDLRMWSTEIEELWDPYPADRLVKLARKYPKLLTYEEDLIWKVIKDESSFWTRSGKSIKASTKKLGDRLAADAQGKDYELAEPNMPRIREHWDKIKAAANGEPVDFTQSDTEG